MEAAGVDSRFDHLGRCIQAREFVVVRSRPPMRTAQDRADKPAPGLLAWSLGPAVALAQTDVLLSVA
jgi:hypothetical protein